MRALRAPPRRSASRPCPSKPALWLRRGTCGVGGAVPASTSCGQSHLRVGCGSGAGMLQLGLRVLGCKASSVLRASTCLAGRAGRKEAGWECGGARSFSSSAVTMAPIKVTGFTFPGSSLSRLFGFHAGSRAVLLDVSSCHVFSKTLSLLLRPGTFLELPSHIYATSRDKSPPFSSDRMLCHFPHS